MLYKMKRPEARTTLMERAHIVLYENKTVKIKIDKKLKKPQVLILILTDSVQNLTFSLRFLP